MSNYKEVTEYCPFCDTENTWVVKENEKFDYCKNCGKLLHFCDECMYNNDNKCMPSSNNSYCHSRILRKFI